MNDMTIQRSAMFESVGQALHVAYLILSCEAQQDAPLRKALISMMSFANHLTEQQNEWFEQLLGKSQEKIGTINFSGMTSLEVRAQCGMIVSAVESKLPDPEKWVVQARFGQMAAACSDVLDRRRIAERFVELTRERYKDQVGSEDMIVRAEAELAKVGQGPKLALSMTRIAAIQGLSNWLQPTYSTIAPMAMDCLLAKAFHKHEASRISFRDLESTFGAGKSTYQRAYGLIKQSLDTLTAKACTRLEPYFHEQGIIHLMKNTA